MEQSYSQIRAYIEAHRGEMLALWEELVNLESGPKQKEGVAQVCNALRREMTAAGVSARVIPMEHAGDVLIGEWNMTAGKQPILFIGHMDTVFQPGAAKENPFCIDESGRAHGPGVLDMKGGLVVALYALKALQSIGFDARPIKFVFAGDEETMHKFSNAKEVMASEMQGAQAAFNFETGYLEDTLVVGRKGGGIATITVTGVSAHSGIAPEKGRSAILEACHKIIALEAQNDIPRGKLINCGLISGGIGENTIPGECKIGVGYRFPTMAVKAEIMQAIEDAVSRCTVPDTSASYEINMNMDCMETTDGVLALFEHVKKVAADCGYGDVTAFSVGGISDSAISVVCGIPTVCGMGVRGTGNHTPQEFAEVESLFERCLLTACAVYSY